MSYKLIIDSCGELTDDMAARGVCDRAPLTIMLDGEVIVDDETFVQSEFLEKMRSVKECPRSACPSPGMYYEKFKGDVHHIYVVTLSSELSGSYNSAVVGKGMYEEEFGDKNIHVFDSKSASVGETLIGLKILQCEDEGLSFADTVKRVETYIKQQSTYFVLETLDILRKNGRLTSLKAAVANVLNIKPIMGSTPEGGICLLGQGRGMKSAIKKMVDIVISDIGCPEMKVLAIAHCNAVKRALELKEEFEKRAVFKKIIVVETRGISSMYAADGGVIVSV